MTDSKSLSAKDILSVTYVDVDTVTGRLNENLPKVTSKLVPQSKPKNDNNVIQQ